MSRTKTKNITWSFNRWIGEVGVLVKWRLTMTVVLSSVLAFAIAAGTEISLLPVVVLALGGFLVAGAANAINQVLERDFDKMMERTKDRPVASNRMPLSEAVAIAGIMLLFGVIALALFNPLAAFLGVLSFIIYSFIYTPIKRYSTLAVAIGAIPGALPSLIGCVAFQGEITWLAILLFGIQFLWQFPHFWAIGWLSFGEYHKAGYKLLPSKGDEIDPSLGINSLLYAVLLIPVCVAAYVTGIVGIGTTVALTLLSVWFALKAYKFYSDFDRPSARKLMFSSFAYLPVAFTIILIGSLI